MLALFRRAAVILHGSIISAYKNDPCHDIHMLDAAHAGRRTVFNIAGNTYWLIARINYRTQRVYILHILTHQDYDKGNWK